MFKTFVSLLSGHASYHQARYLNLLDERNINAIQYSVVKFCILTVAGTKSASRQRFDYVLYCE
jgi:hypothetical protein